MNSSNDDHWAGSSMTHAGFSGRAWSVSCWRRKIRSTSRSESFQNASGDILKRHPEANELMFWLYLETSPQDNLTPKASERPETRLELLTRTSSVRFVAHVLISSRIKHSMELVPQHSFLLQIPRGRRRLSEKSYFPHRWNDNFAPNTMFLTLSTTSLRTHRWNDNF